MDQAACELSDPGPFLGVPILGQDQDALGVIRAIRRRGNRPFDDEDKRRLEWVARFLALSFIQERMRVDLIEGLISIATGDGESNALEKIADQATGLLRHPVAVFLREPSTKHAPPRYVFRAPSQIEDRIAQKVYTPDSTGYTPLVLFDNRPHVLSPNLAVDTLEGGPLHDVGHVRKSAEVGSSESASFVADPIPDIDGSGLPKGVIRASSAQPYAFSHRDVETLRALARQVAVVLKKQEEQIERQALFQTIVDASSRPILAIDHRARVSACNDAMATILGVGKEQVLGRKLLDAVYGGKRKLASANDFALRSKGVLRGHFTTIYRQTATGLLTIPVRVDASLLYSGATREPIGAVAYIEDLRGEHHNDHLTRLGRDPQKQLITVDPLTAAEVHRVTTELDPDSDLPVLISGETGVGKELLASAAAEALRRPECRHINCAGLGEEILESELFGAEEGAATGVRKHDGVFDPHFVGTVVLDEVQELSLRTQAKLLRVLESGRVRKVGAVREQALGNNIRVVALTNGNLRALEEAGQFRRDLLFRLDGFVFNLRPLRERIADIMQLADHFVALELEKKPDGPQGFSSEAVAAMLHHSWPGNIRELRKAVGSAFARATAANPQVRLIGLEDLPVRIRTSLPVELRAPMPSTAPESDGRLKALQDILSDLEARTSRLEASRNPSTGYREMLRDAVATDPSLMIKIREQGARAIKSYFTNRGQRPPAKSTLYDLLRELLGQAPPSEAVRSGLSQVRPRTSGRSSSATISPPKT